MPNATAPDGAMIAELLCERYPLRRGETLTVAVNRSEHEMTARLDAGRDIYTIRVRYLRGAGERDLWMLVADALDGLFGMFIESDRAHRFLPTGDDVEYEGAFFRVRVEREVPALSEEADRLLGESAD